VERQRQGVLGRLDLLDHRRLDDAFGEDRTGDAGVTSLIVTLDRGDQPHVGVIKKGLKVRAALIFLFGAGLRIGADAGDRPVDRPVLLDEVPIVVEQRFLQTGVGLIIELGAQDRANGIPDGYQAPDDIGVLLEQAGVAAPGLHADFGGNSVDDLVEDAAQNEIAAFLEVSFVGRCADFHVRGDIQPVAQRCRAIDRAVGAFMSRCDRRQGGRERGFQLDTGFGRAGVFHAELAAAPLMDPEHMIGMVEEVAVDPERPEAFVAVGNLGQFDPVSDGERRIGRALAEEQDIDDDVGAGLFLHGLAREAHRSQEVGDGLHVETGFRIALVQRISGRHEQRDAARAKLLERPRDEEVVERQAQATELALVVDGEVRERRIADREIEVGRQGSLVEVDAADDLIGIERVCDAGGDGVVLDTDEDRVVGEIVRPEPHEEAAAASRLEDLAAAEAEDAGGVPHCPDDIFGRVMGILRCALERLELALGRFGDQALAEVFPALADPPVRSAKILFASSDAPKPTNRAIAACSPGMAGLCSRSRRFRCLIASILSCARPFQDGDRVRAPANEKSNDAAGGVPGRDRSRTGQGKSAARCRGRWPRWRRQRSGRSRG
jgi:hypothetical protein